MYNTNFYEAMSELDKLNLDNKLEEKKITTLSQLAYEFEHCKDPIPKTMPAIMDRDALEFSKLLKRWKPYINKPVSIEAVLSFLQDISDYLYNFDDGLYISINYKPYTTILDAISSMKRLKIDWNATDNCIINYESEIGWFEKALYPSQADAFNKDWEVLGHAFEFTVQVYIKQDNEFAFLDKRIEKKFKKFIK